MNTSCTSAIRVARLTATARPEFVIDRATNITDFLVDAGAKAVVIACNTATAIAVESLRARFAVPIVAIEPAVKPAATRTRSRVVGVLATTGMLSSPNMSKLLANYGSDVDFVIQPCPGLADQVEKGELASDADARAGQALRAADRRQGRRYHRPRMHALSVPAAAHSGGGGTGGRYHRPCDACCARAAAPPRISRID